MMGEQTGRNSVSHLEKLEAINRRRLYLRRTAPFSISPVAADIMFWVYYCNLKGLPINVTSLITYCRGSDRTIRSHLRMLIQGGWICTVTPDEDRREFRIELTEKGLEVMRRYVELH